MPCDIDTIGTAATRRRSGRTATRLLKLSCKICGRQGIRQRIRQRGQDVSRLPQAGSRLTITKLTNDSFINLLPMFLASRRDRDRQCETCTFRTLEGTCQWAASGHSYCHSVIANILQYLSYSLTILSIASYRTSVYSAAHSAGEPSCRHLPTWTSYKTYINQHVQPICWLLRLIYHMQRSSRDCPIRVKDQIGDDQRVIRQTWTIGRSLRAR